MNSGTAAHAGANARAPTTPGGAAYKEVPDRMNLRDLRRGVSFGTLAVGMFFVAFALSAALMPSQNDTFWHLRAGEDIWRTHHVPRVDTYSFTSGGWPWRDHEWLWQPVSHLIYRLGGMPLLTLFAGALAVAAVVLAYRLMVGRTGTKCLLMAVWLPLLPSGWSVRPQLLSLLAVPLLLTLLVRQRTWPIPLLFVVWANVHGAVALGGVMLGAATVAALVRWRLRRTPEDRRRALTLSAVLPLSALACLVTPLGTGIFHFLSDSMRRIRAVNIEEWRSSFTLEGVTVCFWIFAAAFVMIALRRRRALGDGGHASSWASWVTVACAFALLPLAIMAIRNVAPFSLLAVPAASHLLGAAFRLRAPRRDPGPATQAGGEHPIINLVILSVMAVVTIGLVARNYLTANERLGWHPIDDRALAAVRGCDGPLYNHYDQGGYLIWFVPEKPVFVDGRQDPYPLEHVLAAADVERGGAPYRPLFDRWGIRCAFLPVESPTVAALDRDGWAVRYRDRKWAVLEAPRAGALRRAVYDDGMNLRGLVSRFGFAQLATGMMFVAFALRALLMPAQNDTFWHLRAGPGHLAHAARCPASTTIRTRSRARPGRTTNGCRRR